MYVDDLLIIKFAKEKAKKEGLAKGLAEGLAKGMAEGLAKGLAKGRIEIAKKMLNDGFDAEAIAKYTELTVDEVEKLSPSKMSYTI